MIKQLLTHLAKKYLGLVDKAFHQQKNGTNLALREERESLALQLADDSYDSTLARKLLKKWGVQ